MTLKAIELFAGAGGLGIGVSHAGFKPVSVVEWDHWCCDTLRENVLRGVKSVGHWPQPIEKDVREVDFAKYEGKVQLVTGGPPCQPFSMGGKHKAYNDHRDMWSEAVRTVRETKPQAFIFENVKGLTRASFNEYFVYIKHQLSYPEITRKDDESWVDHLARLEKHATSNGRAALTYNVVPRLLNAANFGIPQRRERVVFVGFREDLSVNWSFPEETHSQDALLWQQCHSNEYWERHKIAKRHRVIDGRFQVRGDRLDGKPSKLAWKTTRDAIGDLPDPEDDEDAASAIPNHRFQPGARSYPGHTGSPLDEPAKTLKAGVHGVPGGENMLVRPNGTVRYFTVRESARLQTFPDDFVFHGSWSETMRQLGNAVPVELAHIVAKNVKRYLKAA